MVRASKFGRMVANMKVTGKTIRLMDMDVLFTQMATVIMETGSMTKPMAGAHMNTWTAPNTSVTGKKINSMATV